MKRNLSWNVFGVVVLIANLLPTPALAAPSSGNNPEPAEALLDLSAVLPAWFAAGNSVNPAHAVASNDVLPGWFTNLNEPLASPPASPDFQPLQVALPESVLSVNVYGPAVASLGSPPGVGEVYTAVIRNSSAISIAYGIYLTSVHPAYFIHDGGDQIITGTGAVTAAIPFSLSTDSTTITWTPQITLDLAPGQALTLSFKLRAACDADSGQQMRVGIRYNADPAQPPVELNTGGLNITTGRGNLVIKKEPGIQSLSSSDYGRPITWTVTVQNTGLGILYGAAVTDTGGISLSQPGGDLVPSVFITSLQINETRAFTVVGTVRACNFTNVAQAAWTCGNLARDATFTNPVSSTVSILFSPSIPRINLQASSPITFPYCAPLMRTVVVTITNTGGPGGSFRLDSNLESNGFLHIITSSINSGWQYEPVSGTFAYVGGSPTGTVPGPTGSAPVTLTFDVRPNAEVCAAGNGSVAFDPLFSDVCSGEPFHANPVEWSYRYAQNEAPTIGIVKSGPSLVASGEVFTYTITVTGTNPDHIAGALNIADVLPAPFVLIGSPVSSTGVVTVAGQSLAWSFDPPDAPSPFNATLVYQVRVVPTQTLCGASQVVYNNAQVAATPTCPGCSVLIQTARVGTAIVNNEGIEADRGHAGATQACGTGGLTIYNRFVISGSSVVTWTGAVFTDALGTDLGSGALPPGAPPLVYRTNSLRVTVGITDYTYLLTPTTNLSGQLVIDLSPLQAAEAPTQNVTLLMTYTVDITEATLMGANHISFYDWSRLYLPNVTTANACASDQSFNGALWLTLSRGDLSVRLEPTSLNRCGANTATIYVEHPAGAIPSDITDHIVVTFTASVQEVMSARNFTLGGSLAPLSSSISIVTDTAISGGRGIITFTLPVTADIDSNGTIQFDIDVLCTGGLPWNAGITFQTACLVPHQQGTTLDHIYLAPDLILFATPIEYTVRQREVVWKFFVANNGNLAADSVVVTNTLYGISVTSYARSSGTAGVALVGTLPITGAAVFSITNLLPNDAVEVMVTGTVFLCDPLSVDIEARLDCLAATCEQPQRHIRFNTPPPYLLTNNGQTADLPMCDVGNIVFRTKNASPDVSLYQLDITETLQGPLPEAPPYTLTILSASGAVITTTTAFTPERITGTDTLLVWRAISAPLGLFDSLAPLSVVVITVPVRTGCVPPNSPQSFASASAQGPCGKQLGYTENAVTLQTARPHMTIEKLGRGPTGGFGEFVAANPGDPIIWRLRVENQNIDHPHVAYNVTLSDTWPANFNFFTATADYSPTFMTSTRTITWNLGTVEPGIPHYFYITGTLTGTACQARTENASRLSFGCADGCGSSDVPVDYAYVDSAPDLRVSLAPGPLQTCGGDIPVTIRNYGSTAYTTTLTVTLPSGYVYSETVSSVLTPTEIIITPTSSPQFRWDTIPGRPNPATDSFYEFTLSLRVRNSGSSGACPVSDNQPVRADLEYDNDTACTPTNGPFTRTASTNLTVLSPTLEIAKTPSAQIGAVGQRITWTIALTNVGTGTAPNLIVTDVVGSNYDPASILASNGSDGATPTRVNNIVIWTIASVPVSGTWAVTVSAALVSTGDNRNVVTASSSCATGCQAATASDTAYTTLVQDFKKNPAIQTGTLGSLAVFTFAVSLPDQDAMYASLILTDALPAGLGCVSSTVEYSFNTGTSGNLISNTPTITPGWLASGNMVWQFGDLSGAVQVNGGITAVIQNITPNYDGVRLTNVLTMTYSDTGLPFVYTDTARVDIVEPSVTLRKFVSSSTGSLNALDGNALLTYTLSLTNTGTNPAYDVLITDAMPSGINVTALYGGDSHSGPMQGPGIFTWTVAVMSNTIPGANNPLVLTYTAFLSGATTSAAPSVRLTNTVTATYASLPGHPFPQEDRLYGPITSTATITTALAGLIKSVAPATTPTSNFKIGDVLTYSVVLTVPPGLVAWWPYVYDDLPRGVRYVTGTLSVTGTMPFSDSNPLAESSPWFSRNASGDVGVTGATAITNPNAGPSTLGNERQAIEWWLDPLNNAGSSSVGLVTATFQAQILGVDLNGTSVLLNAASQSFTNGATSLWTLNDNNGYTSTDVLIVRNSNVVTSYVGNPFLGIVKTAQPPSGSFVGAGQTITYSLVITNSGVVPAFDMVISDTLPAGLTYVTSTITGTTPPTVAFTYQPPLSATGDITWSVNQLDGSDPGAAGATHSMTVTLVAQVADVITASIRLTNTAAIPYYDSQPGPGPQTELTPTQRVYTTEGVSTAWHQMPNSGITKTVLFSPPPATLGSLVTYTLIVPTLPITATLYNVLVTDTIHPSMTVESVITSGGTGGLWGISGQVVTATFDSIPHDMQAFITITGRINDGLGASTGYVIADVGRMSHATAPVTTSNPVSTTVGEPRLLRSKSVTSTANLNRLDGTATVTYSIRMTNTGSSPAYSVHITDAVPAGISVTAQYGGDAQSGPVVGPGVMTWTVNVISNVASANMAALTYTARISLATSSARLTNTVDILYHSLTETTPGVRPYITTTTATVGVLSPTISKATEPITLRVGDLVTYHLVFTIPAGTVGMGGNNSYLWDVLPQGIWYITDTEVLTWTPSAVDVTTTGRVSGTLSGAQVITWTFSQPITSQQDTPTVITLSFRTQAVGLRIDTQASVWPTQTASAPITDTVGLWQSGGQIGTAQANNQVIQPSLSILKRSVPPSGSYVGAGNLITYTVIVTNSGHGPAYDIVISDALPSGITYLTSSIGSAAPPTITLVAQPAVSSTGVITWQVNELWGTDWNSNQPGVAFITLTTRVTDTIGANLRLTNTVAITYYDSQLITGAGPYPPSQRVYTDGQSSVYHLTANPGITKSVSPPTATLGSVITYVIVVPAPPITATLYAVTITDQLSTALQLQSVTDGPDGTVVTAGNALTVTYPSIPPNEQRIITITAVLSDPLRARAGNVITNVATLRHQDGGPIPSNQPTFTVTEPALTLVKASNPPTSNTVGAGDRITYTVAITNRMGVTTSAAYDVAFTDTLPVGLRNAAPQIITITLNGGPVSSGDYTTHYSSTTGVLTVTCVPTFAIPVGGVLAIQYVATVDSDVQAAIHLSNLAEVTWSSLGGAVPGDRNYGPITGTTTLHTPMVTTLGKTLTPPTVTIGSRVVFTISMPGTPIGAVLSNVVVTDVVDSRLQIVTVSPPATINGQVVTATFSDIPTYTQELIVITATVRDLGTVTNSARITNVARMDYTGNPSGTIPSNVVTVTAAEPSATLDKSVRTPRNPVGAGDTVTYTLALSNTGMWPAYDVVITDALPSGVGFIATQQFTVTNPVTATLDSNVAGSGVLTWGVSQLNVGGYIWITFTARVSDTIAARLTLTNAAWGEYSGQPGSPPTERHYTILTDTATITTGQPAFDLRKSASPSPAPVGELLTYTLIVTNTGIVSATNVFITDVVPVNTNFVTATMPYTGPDASRVISWSLGTLDIGVPRAVTMVVSVTSPLISGTLITNVAWVTSTEGVSDTSTITTPVTSQRAITLTKSAIPSSVQAGDLLTYTLLYAVTGNGVAPDVTISDTTPQSTTFWSASPPATTAPAQGSTGLVVWQLGSISPTFTGAVTMVVHVNTPLMSGTQLVNVAILTDSQNVTSTNTLTTPVASAHTLQVVKSVTPTSVSPGGWLTYTVAYTVTGNEPAYNVTLSDTVPAHTIFVTATLPHTRTGDLVRWPLGNLLTATSGLTQQTGVVTLVVQANTPLTNGLSIVNRVLISDTSSLTDTSVVATPVTSQHALTLTKSAIPSSAQAGDLLTYTLLYTSPGDGIAPDATISDTTPQSTTFWSASPPTTTAPAQGNIGLVVWQLGSISPTFTGAVTMVVRVNTPLISGTQTVNVAILSDSQGISSTGTVTTPVASAHTLQVVKSVTPTSVSPGGWLTYTVAYTVTGNEPMYDVTLSDTVPLHTSFVTATLPHTLAGDLVRWPLGNLLTATSGLTQQTGVVTLVAQVNTPLLTGTLIVNRVAITDSQGISHTDQITTPVQSAHVIAITKIAAPSPVAAGGALVYTLVWSVSGNEPALDLTISDTVPANAIFITGTTPIMVNGGLLTWPLGDHVPGDSGLVTFTVQVTQPLVSGTLIYNAAILTDSSGITRTSDVTVPVVSAHTLDVFKSATPAIVRPGDWLTYTIAYTITGNEPVFNVTLSDTVPAHTTFVTATSPHTLTGDLVLWPVGDYLPAASGVTQATGVVTLVVQADTPLTNGLSIVNTVLITDSSPLTDTHTVTTPVTSQHVISLTKSAAPDPVLAGDLLTYTLSYIITGDGIAPDVTLSDTTPQSTTFWSATPPPATAPFLGYSGLVIWQLGSISPPAGGMVTMVVRVNSPLISGTLIYNAAVITDSSGITRTGDVTTPVVSSHTLGIVKTAAPSPVAAGGTLLYTLAWSVGGNEPAFDVTISDTLPANTSFVTGTTPVVVNGNLLTWPLGNHVPGDSGMVTFTVQVAQPLVSGTLILNSVIVTDSSGITHTDTVTTPVVTTHTLSVVKSAFPSSVHAGGWLTYTIAWRVGGNETAPNVTLSETVPHSTTYQSCYGGLTCNQSGSLVSWSLGTVNPPATGVVTLVVQVDSPLARGTLLYNSVTITDSSGLTDTHSITTPVLTPGLVIAKSVTPGQAAPHQPFTYTIRITNTGQITFNPLVLTDTLPPNFNYVVGTDSPTDPNTIAEPLLQWNNLGPLAPGADITVTFAVTVERGLTGTFINVALVEGVTPRGILTDTDDVPVVLRDPAVAIQKQLVAADLDPLAPNLVTFTIAITNVGPTAIAMLPLLDQYDPYYLAFAWANPMPDEPQDDGLLTWYDLTAPAPHGFGRDLPPSEAFHLTTVFTVAHDITTTTFNTVVISRAVDIFDNPTNRPADTAPITNTIPTAVELLYFRVDGVTGQQVRLTWATAVEIDNYGFNLYRADVNDPARAKLIHFEPSALRGPRPGATYVYVDTVPSDGVWWYWLADVNTRGNETRSMQAGVRAEVNATLRYRVYLPVVLKRP